MVVKQVLALSCLCIVAGCSSSDITSPDQIVFPATNVSFTQHVQPFFALSCNNVGCHDAGRADNYDTDLTSWVRVRDAHVTLPGDTACGLIRVIYAREVHYGALNLNENQREGLKQWVLEGAQNN
jgi:hypothetical protein